MLLLKKKSFLFWAWSMGTPFLQKLGQKIVIFRDFSNFFHNYWIPIKVLNINWIPKYTLLENSKKKIKLDVVFGPNYVQCCEKSKETGNIIRFFSYFTRGLPLIARSSGNLWQLKLEMPNFKDVRANFLLDLGQKWQKTNNIQ